MVFSFKMSDGAGTPGYLSPKLLPYYPGTQVLKYLRYGEVIYSSCHQNGPFPSTCLEGPSGISELQFALPQSVFPHVDHTSDAVSRFHIIESLVNFGKRLSVGNEFVDLKFAFHVVAD